MLHVSSASLSVSWREEGQPSSFEPSFQLFRRPQDGSACEVLIQLPEEVAGGLRLISSARIAEVYVLQASGDRSYACSLRGTPAPPSQQQPGQQPGQQQGQQQSEKQQQQPEQPELWAIEYRWQQAQRVPALMLRLLSLAQRDILHLASLQLLPAQAYAAALHPAAQRAAAPTAATEGRGLAAGAAAAGAAVAAEAAAAAPVEAAASVSQMDEIRGLLSQLAAEDSSSSRSIAAAAAAATDPKRSLMAAIARSVLQQPSASASRQPAQAEGVAATQHQRWLQGGHQQLGAQLQGQEAGHPRQQQPPQQQQQQQQEAAAALHRLEGRVAALEGLCREMHCMLRQLLAAQQVQQAA